MPVGVWIGVEASEGGIGYCGRYSECGGSSVRLMCRLGGKGHRVASIGMEGGYGARGMRWGRCRRIIGGWSERSGAGGAGWVCD